MDNYIYITIDTTKLEIEDVIIVLPSSLIKTAAMRCKKQKNLRYNTDTKSVEILCAKCKTWFPIFNLQDGNLYEINDFDTYKSSQDKQSKDSYYGSYCCTCAKSKNDKLQDTDKTSIETMPLKSSNQKEWSTEFQHTIFLSEVNDKYLWELHCKTRLNKHALLNEIINICRSNNLL